MPKSELVRGAPNDAIPAVTEPEFGADWSGVSVTTKGQFRGEYTAHPRLDPADEVIGIERDGDALMNAGGSAWDRTTGRAIDGPHEGRRLPQAGEATAVFWFAWRDFHPGTSLYGEGSG